MSKNSIDNSLISVFVLELFKDFWYQASMVLIDRHLLLTDLLLRSVLAKYQTDACFSTNQDERCVSSSVQKQRSDISLVHTEHARSIRGLLYGFTEI